MTPRSTQPPHDAQPPHDTQPPHDAQPPRTHRRVAVFREAWLAGSETFIRNQVGLLCRWEAHPIGMKRVASPIAADTDLIVAPAGIRGRFARVGLRWFGRSRRLETALAALQPDLIHAHFARDAIIIAPVAARLNIPLVTTLHGSDITALPAASGPVGRRYRRRLRSLFAQAAHIIAVSEFIRAQALRYGAPAVRTTVAYIGIPSTGKPDPAAEAGTLLSTAAEAPGASTATVPEAPGARSAMGACRILFLGRLVEKKGVADAIEAIAGLPAELRGRVHLTVAGGGPLRAELEARARMRGVSACFTGPVDGAQARALFAASDVFLAPSRQAPDGDSEGFGMVFLEAAAAGLPVVAYRHGGVPEAVADGCTGLLAAEGDIAGLTAALHSLITDPGRAAELGQAGSRRAAEEFDCAVLTADLEALYDQVVDAQVVETRGADAQVADAQVADARVAE